MLSVGTESLSVDDKSAYEIAAPTTENVLNMQWLYLCVCKTYQIER